MSKSFSIGIATDDDNQEKIDERKK